MTTSVTLTNTLRKTLHTNRTVNRMRTDIACIRQLNVVQLSCMAVDGHGTPLTVNIYIKPFST